jgi:hypothetical protein
MPSLDAANHFLSNLDCGIGLAARARKICIALVARGTCNLDAGETNLVDSDLIRQLRDKATRI